MKLLLVDDHAEARASLAGFLDQLGHEVVEADGAERALALCRAARPDLVLTDLRMPGMNGLDLLQAVAALDAPPPVALMTAFGDTDTAIEAVRRGAVDYLRKPIDVSEVHRLVERIAAERGPLPTTPDASTVVDGLVVAGAHLARLVALADRLHAASDLPCLIEGETGVGKELIARRIHHGGRPAQARGPFITLNCSAIAPALFEAELFGHAAGAAATAAPGKAAQAGSGTLFLDEVGDLPLEQQAKLLRLIESRSFYELGGRQEQRLRARVVCATNARLVELVRAGRFREDLYYRLKVGHLRIPPLRDRAAEIEPLARALLADVRSRRGRGFRELSTAARTLIATHPWPGNVRQLKHALEQACLAHDGAVLDAPHLEEALAEPPRPGANGVAEEPLPLSPERALKLDPAGFDLEAWEKAVVAAALAANGNSPVRAAAFLRISRKVLYTLRKRYGLLGRREH